MSSLRSGIVLLAVVALGLGEPARGDTPAIVSKSKQAKSQRLRTDLYGDPLPAGAIGRLGTVRSRHRAPVLCLAFSPDGKTVVSGGAESSLRVWEIATGKEVGQFKIEANSVDAVAFSPSGKIVAAAGSRVIYLWDAASGREIGRLSGHGDDITQLTFSGDGKTLASGSKDTVRLWDVKGGKEIRKLIGHGHTVNSVELSWDGKLVASGSSDLTVRVWESKTGMEFHRFRLGSVEAKESGNVPAVAFSPDGKFLAAAADHWKGSAQKWTTKAVLWDVGTGKELQSFHKDGQWIGGVHFIQGGKVLAADVDGIVRFVEVATGKETKKFPIDGRFIVFSPDEQYLASACQCAVRIWKANTGQELNRFAGHTGTIELLAIAPNGHTLISASDDHTARVWDMATGNQLRSYGEKEPNGIRVRAISSDCRLLAWDEFGGEVIHLLDTASGKEIGRIRKANEEGKKIYGIWASFSPDGLTLAERELVYDQQSHDRVRLWDIATGKEIRRFYEGKGVHSPVHFSSDGKILAVANRRWEVATGKELPRFGNENSYIQAFSPDGRTVASCDKETLSLRLLKAGSGKELFRLPARTGGIVFSPEGRTVAAQSYEDGQIILWEVASRQERGRFADHAQSSECALSFTPDSMTLASGHDDSTILLWDVTGLRSNGQLPKLRLSPEEVADLWAKLADGDAAKAYQAIWKLAAAPQQATLFLKEHLKRVTPVDPKRIQILVAKLNDERFAEREKATKELENLTELAAPALRNVLSEKPPLEVQRRAEGLLDQLDGVVTSAERLRPLRAVEVLEHIGTPDAQEVLRTLVKGGPKPG